MLYHNFAGHFAADGDAGVLDADDDVSADFGNDGDRCATTKPRFSRCCFVSALPPIFLMKFSSPVFAIVKGIINHSLIDTG
jgi:hypothetical protein